MTAVRMDLNHLFDAIAERDETAITTDIANGLLDGIRPSMIAGRLAIAAAFGDAPGTALPPLVAAGQIGDWIRMIPPGPEPGAERRQMLLPAIPLANAAIFAAPAIKQGITSQHLNLPDPLFPKDVTHKEGSWGALRDAVKAADTQTAARVLMGFYGSGTDYREIEGSLYYAINAKFAADGLPLLALTKATQALDFVEWGDRFPILLQWLLPQLVKTDAEPAGAPEVRAFLALPDNNLDFVRKRLQMSNPAAAGAALRQAVAQGKTPDVLAAVFIALKEGATGPQVAAQLCAVAADHLAGMPANGGDALQQAVIVARVANAARLAVTYVQDLRVLPIIFHTANLVNQTIKASASKRVEPKAGAVSSPLAGGLIEFGVLRNIERQLAIRDEGGARATALRYAQMGFAGRSLMGTLGLVAARTTIAADGNGRALLALQALGEDYLALTPAQQGAEGVALINAALHLIATQPDDQAQAQRIGQTLAI